METSFDISEFVSCAECDIIISNTKTHYQQPHCFLKPGLVYVNIHIVDECLWTDCFLSEDIFPNRCSLAICSKTNNMDNQYQSLTFDLKDNIQQ